MRLFIGGRAQGQSGYVREATGRTPEKVGPEGALSAPAIDEFHEVIREVIRKGGDAEQFARELAEKNPDAVIVCDEVGMGIVPIDREERLWREAVGRAMCLLAERAESFERVICGIGVKVK